MISKVCLAKIKVFLLKNNVFLSDGCYTANANKPSGEPTRVLDLQNSLVFAAFSFFTFDSKLQISLVFVMVSMGWL